MIGLTRKLPYGWLGRRLALLLRRLVLSRLDHPLDVEVFGAAMRLHPFNNICEKRILFTPQFFDVRERGILAKAARPGFVFIDVGANVGAYALFVAGVTGPGARILAIEPQPAVFERLVYNVAQNPTGTVKAIACAVADRDGEVTLFIDADNSGGSSVKLLAWQGGEGEAVRVPAKTLLRIAEEEGLTHIDALKLDVEGAEDLILVPFLRDAPERLLPRIVIIEHGMEHGGAGWQVDCVEALKHRGYAIVATTRLNHVLERAGFNGSSNGGTAA